MKARHLLWIMLILLGMNSCEKSDESQNLPPEIARVISGLNQSFDTLNTSMTDNTWALALRPNDTAHIRNLMRVMEVQSSFVMEFSFVNPSGIMQIVEPAEYHYIQGSDISKQDHIIQTFSTKEPALSKVFHAVEGFEAAVDVHPVVNSENHSLLGGVTALFKPQSVLQRLILPLVKNQSFEIWVMEKGGRVLFDQDEMEIGRNVITDTLYAAFPELITAAKLIDSEKSGETSYSFYQTGTQQKVVKKTYWDTWTMHGTEWKIIWVKPE